MPGPHKPALTPWVCVGFPFAPTMGLLGLTKDIKWLSVIWWLGMI